MNTPDLHHWTQNSCFGEFLFRLGAFRTVSLLRETRWKWANLVQLMQKFMPRSRVRIFHYDAPDPHHWTLNSCFGVFLSVWVHLEPFCYYTKLAAKRAKLVQLMQKFVPRCLVRIFCNEHSWSTQLYPKLMFWCVSFRLGAFVTVSLLHETWCKTRQTCAINVKVQFFTTNAHATHHWTLNSWFGGFFPFGCIWDHFAIARTRAKLVQLMQKFLPRCLVRIFSQRTFLIHANGT